MGFHWRNHTKAIEHILSVWNKAALANEGWSRPKECLWIEGAIFGLTGKKVHVECMVDICEALGVPYRRLDGDKIAWGDCA